ncbi:adenylate/guanylate cyclase domain-containing protein [Mycobacterium simiae]|uniref:Adenylate/guanylate cyclase domain-containing protein n=1 Tax=Mycobacterium simiae TaxID=1784 RepID=A0A5B1BS28_MYCSI|nr:adenylate/guanylate cyclase domain-containing protein [Mycobacterium simiae]
MTQLSKLQREAMTPTLAQLNREVAEIIAARGGKYLAEQCGSDTFGATFVQASDAVATALELQRAALAPLRLGIGIHTGELGPLCTTHTMSHAARLRDFAHGGQTVMSRATEEAVHGRLPARAWLMNLSAQTLHREGLGPVVQLCHRAICSDFAIALGHHGRAVARLRESR